MSSQEYDVFSVPIFNIQYYMTPTVQSATSSLKYNGRLHFLFNVLLIIKVLKQTELHALFHVA